MRKVLAVFCGFGVAFAVLTAPAATADPVADALARDLGISASEARTRLAQQARAHAVSARLSVSDAGRWFDAASGRLTVAVTRPEDAAAVRAAGAEAQLVSRSAADLAVLCALVLVAGRSAMARTTRSVTSRSRSAGSRLRLPVPLLLR